MLVHLGLPDCEALATVEQIRKAAPETPIAVLSEVADEELAIKAVKAGSQDYLVKREVDLSLIERSLRHAVDDALLQYLSPLGWEHINLTGDYLWRSSAKIGAGKFRPLRPLQPA